MRRGVGLTVLVVAALAVLGLAVLLVPAPPGMIVTIVNESPAPLSGLALASGETTKSISTIAPRHSVDVRPYPSAGENSLVLVDSRGRHYTLLGYFEGAPSGTVKVRLQGTSAGALRGEVVADTSYPGTSFTSPLRLDQP